MSYAEWSLQQVSDWLQSKNLGEFAELFSSNHINGLELKTLENDDLVQMGISSVGQRKMITRALEELRGSAKPRIKKIAIEGNIAAGKSTFLNILAREIDFHVVPEPVSRWTNMTADGDDSNGPSSSQANGGNLLDMFYSDPKRYAYTFQTYAFLSRMRAQMRPPTFFSRYSMGPSLKAPVESDGKDTEIEVSTSDDNSAVGSKRSASESSSDASSSSSSSSSSASASDSKKSKVISSNVQFFERSVYSDRYCFALNCYDSGLFSDTEYACYTDWHTWLLTAFPQLELDGFIYLRVDPKVCMKRLEKRNRSEEGSVKLDYLESVHLRHEEWLIEKLPSDPVAISVRNTKMLIINADEEFETNPARQAEMLRQIREFIAQL